MNQLLSLACLAAWLIAEGPAVAAELTFPLRMELAAEGAEGWLLPKAGTAPKVEFVTEDGRKFARVSSGAQRAYAAFPTVKEAGGMKAFVTAARAAYPGREDAERNWERGAYKQELATAVAATWAVKGMEWETVKVALELRVPQLQLAANGGQGGFRILTPGGILGPNPTQPTSAWVRREVTVPLKPDSRRLEITFGFTEAQGVFEIANVEMTVTKLRPAVEDRAPEFTVRGGLPNVARKLQAGGAVKIGYLGGSITAQKGWRPQTLAWFRERYPQAKVDEIVAAIGGTGSDLGVFRVAQDVIVHGPDLVFVEFAVNDATAPRQRIHQTMEGIARKIWRANPATDICFVYTLMYGEMEEDLALGRYPPAARAMEEVAAHYGIPTVHMGVEVARLQREGKLKIMSFKTKEERRKGIAEGYWHFSSDGVHPYEDTGHVLYTRAVARGLEKMLPAGKPGPHDLPVPLDADNYEDAQMIPFGDAAKLEGEWSILPATHPWAVKNAERMPKIWSSAQPGAKATIRFKGSLLGTFELIGPSSGRLRVTLDGRDLGVQDRFEKKGALSTTGRLDFATMARDLDPKAEHVVTLELVDFPPAEKKAVLRKDFLNDGKILAAVEDEGEFEKRWGGSAVYFGMVRLRGELVK